MTQHRTAAVIGGGITGMTAAYELKKAGFAVTVFENCNRVGGRVWSVRKGDFLMELGATMYLGTYRDLIAMIHEVGLNTDMVQTVVTLGIPRGGKQHYLDLAKPIRSSITTKAISWPSKIKALRLFADVLKHRAGLGYGTYDGLAKIDTESVLEYSQRALNEELSRYLVGPLVESLWLGHLHETSAALLHWSVRNMLVNSLYGLSSGLDGLPKKLATLVDTRLEHAVTNVTDNGSAVEVSYDSPSRGQQTEIFDAAIIATPARQALSIYPQMDENHRGLYETAGYNATGAVSLGFSSRPNSPVTFFMTSPHEDSDCIGMSAEHNKTPGLAPAGKGLITTYVSPEFLHRNAGKDDQYLIDYALDRVRYYYGNVPGTLEQHAVARWQEAIPTMGKGRFKQIAAFRNDIDHRARVQFASDLEGIPGQNGGTVSGKQAAARVSRRFATAGGRVAVQR